MAVHFRPTTFEDVVSQESIVTILKKQIELKQFKNAYIFYGASGCGKTTCARILANEINQFHGSPIEIDAASYNGVDNVKSIVASARERSLDSEYKIYIIDEAHMLTTQSWNAFLKCIEEPPKYTIFIFCTTEKNKIPDTIKNRCQIFNFNRIPVSAITERLKYICQVDGYPYDISALEYIAKTSNGEMRNAISRLEKVVDYSSNITMNNVVSSLGVFSYDSFISITNNILDGNESGVLNGIETIYEQGSDMTLFVEEYFNFCLDIVKYIIFRHIELTQLPSNIESEVKMLINFNDPSKLYNYYLSNLLELKNMLKTDNNPKSTIEVVFLKMCRLV